MCVCCVCDLFVCGVGYKFVVYCFVLLFDFIAVFICVLYLVHCLFFNFETKRVEVLLSAVMCCIMCTALREMFT